VGRPRPARVTAPQHRIERFFAAGLVDSLGLALGWAVFNLEALDSGLSTVAFYNTAMVVGIVLSAPATARLSAQLTGRQLLRGAAYVEGALRALTFVALLHGASPLLIAAGIVVMHIAAWSGYAAMRAEIATVSRRQVALTMFVMGIAAAEAVGTALGALIPADGSHRVVTMTIVVVAYVGSLGPTVAVAAKGRVRPVPRRHGRRDLSLESPLLVGGLVTMFLGSGPTLLAIALAAEFHGRSVVAASAVAFTVGSLFAPALTRALDRRRIRPTISWPMLGFGMIAGWMLAPVSIAGLAVAQFLSGISITSFEGVMDAQVASRSTHVTADLARAASVRWIGSAFSVMVLPVLVPSVGIEKMAAVAGVLFLSRWAAALVVRRRRAGVGGMLGVLHGPVPLPD
jgi:hypothetical protein